MKHLIFVTGLIALVLGGCATSNEMKWAQGRTALTDVENVLYEAYAPCVEAGGYVNFGPDHPGCLIDDETYVDILKVAKAARYTLARLDGVAAGTEMLSPEILMTELDRLLRQLLLEAAAVQ